MEFIPETVRVSSHAVKLLSNVWEERGKELQHSGTILILAGRVK